MVLAAGTRLGAYEILAHIGGVGRGDVYKVRDTQPQRLPTLRIVPRDKVPGLDRRARFVPEAQAASALSDRHIVTVYGIDPDAESSLDFIAMAYVPSRTLDGTIGQPRLKLKEASGTRFYAFAPAHAARIAHCDLKPGNV
ncbi:MAG: hypothetical protein NTW28_29275 [Candidatus Solibacter sp.]|nr:hypothetical protein [Candidatus Solibacter sp.]